MIGKMLTTFVLLAFMILTGSNMVQAAKPQLVEETVIWNLSKTTVVEPGDTFATEDGVVTAGYTIEAKAEAKSGSLVPEGTFRSIMTVFSPNRDMPGLRAGMWYVQGTWTITKKNASSASLKARHNPDVASGSISAELPFNPAENRSGWSALASLPMSPAAGKWARGKGSLTLDSRLEGDMLLNLTLWPEVR
jgi:hypothetical protein